MSRADYFGEVVPLLILVAMLCSLLMSATYYRRAERRYRVQLDRAVRVQEQAERIQDRAEKLQEAEQRVLERASELLDRLEAKG